MKKRGLLWLMAAGCLAACSESASEEEVLFANVADESGVVKLSEVLSSHALVPLETTEESLVGEVMKIVKENGMYYLACDGRNILMFDGAGKYRGQIDRIGAGPGEYQQMGDFDVLGERIAVLDADKVYFYTLEGDYVRRVELPFIATNIKLLPNGNIMLNASREKEAIVVVDTTGKDMGRYVKFTQSLRLRKTIPFILCDGRIFFQNGAYTADLWWYAVGKEGTARLLDDENAIGTRQEQQWVAQEGFEYPQNHTEALKVDGLTACATQMAFGALAGDRAWLYVLDFPSGRAVRYGLLPGMEGGLEDDITYLDPVVSLGMMTIGASQDGFVSLVQPYLLAEALENHRTRENEPAYAAAKELLARAGDPQQANPILFEFRFK